ncbi:AMP-binding protein [Actinoplanes subtropicus]|uniref:AMP-binding protein n=1 Tax=Actinoplanes subtropicus TaxID=543632 RepID=UPI0004C2DC39|nr:AMP-binding protein [Actinoplanes subtropicus]
MIYRSPVPLPEIPSALLSDHVLRDAERRGGKPALVDASTGESLTFADLLRQSNTGAAGLAADGLRPGEVVGLLSHNQPCYAVAVHAVLRAGGVLSPLNPAMTPAEIGKQLRHCGARALVVAQPLVAVALEAVAGTSVQRLYVLGDDPRVRPFDELTNGTGAPPRLDLDSSKALALLPYSSGTSGQSKGVMLTHRNIVAQLEQQRIGSPVTENDVVCGFLPFFHIYGFTIILNAALTAGATLVTMPRFDLRGYLRVVQDHRVTRGHLVPPVVLALATAPEVAEYDLSSLRVALSGAAPLDEELAVRAQARTGCVIRQGYGLTETSPGTHFVYDLDFSATPAGSVGKPVPGTEARLVDPITGEDVGAGHPGELLVRGPQVMVGYLDDPTATAETIDDGWLRTGDIAQTDEDGNFYIVDRLKELIKYKGYQVAPAELEALLLSHPEVLDAAVIGVPDLAVGEIPKGFIVTRAEPDADKLMAWVAERVAPYKRLRALEFVAEIPKSPSGKTLRRVLKAYDHDASSA